MSYEIISLRQKPDLAEQVNRLSEEAWPKFLRHANTHHWSSLFDTFADYQLILYEPEDGVLAVGHTIPLIWNGTTEDLPEEMNAIMVGRCTSISINKRPRRSRQWRPSSGASVKEKVSAPSS